MGQLDLTSLRSVGEAAARLARMSKTAGWLELLARLEAPLRGLIEARGDTRSVTLPPAFVDGGGWFTESTDEWHRQLWTQDEFAARRDGAGWCFNVGRRPGYEDQSEGFYDAVQQLGLHPTGHFVDLGLLLEGHDRDAPYLDVRVNIADQGALFHDLLKRRESGTLEETRRLLQSLDALTRGSAVAVDFDWAPPLVRDSVMAQIAEWHVRIDGSEYARGGPMLTDDAYQWWCRWARRVARQRDDAVAPGDVFGVAKRSVRPASAAGHHRYWKKSLEAHRADDVVQQVATMLGISRRTVFNRLRKGERRLAEFYGEADAARALYDWLADRPSNANRISDDRRAVIESLEAAGVSHEAARKLERRTRGLPPEVQRNRLQRAIERQRARS